MLSTNKKHTSPKKIFDAISDIICQDFARVDQLLTSKKAAEFSRRSETPAAETFFSTRARWFQPHLSDFNQFQRILFIKKTSSKSTQKKNGYIMIYIYIYICIVNPQVKELLAKALAVIIGGAFVGAFCGLGSLMSFAVREST